MTAQRILLTGGTGFLGRALVAHWLQQGHQLTVLSRNPLAASQCLGDAVDTVSDLTLLPGSAHFDAVVNLAGEPIFGRRWTADRKQQLRDSRIRLTENLLAFIEQLPHKPAVLISGSAIGIYGNQGDTVLTEASTSRPDFSQQLCADWEQAALAGEDLGMRVCLIRTGLVLDSSGGLLARMLPAFRLGLGGAMGSGQQWMSWIDRDDWVALVDYLLHDSLSHGAFNATAPQPVSNADFSRQLAAHLHRPALLPLPAALLKPLLGEMADLVLGSQRVVPQRLLDAGFRFAYPRLDQALKHTLS